VTKVVGVFVRFRAPLHRSVSSNFSTHAQSTSTSLFLIAFKRFALGTGKQLPLPTLRMVAPDLAAGHFENIGRT
jgi:hypothetical protein